MSSTPKLRELCQEISNDCLGCNRCLAECPFLQQIDEDIVSMVRRGPSVEEAYACSLCGLCEAVCPSSLSLRRVFNETRNQAVERNYISIQDYRYMFPDRELNVMKAYRQFYGIEYNDLNPDQASSAAFFPGCTMLTYSPQLTRALFFHLQKTYGRLSLISECCGLPLLQLGLQNRGNDYLRSVKDKLKSWQVKSLVVACPNCYYQLRPFLKDTDIQLVTIFEALKNSDILNTPLDELQKCEITIHDSCPDRFYGIFARQARQALLRKGYSLVEMEHHHDLSICCGSGGQVSHSRPDLAEGLVRCRLDEAERSGASVLAGYCLACVLNFARIPNEKGMKIQHVLDLLLELEADYSEVKTNAQKIFEGPEGEERLKRIMA